MDKGIVKKALITVAIEAFLLGILDHMKNEVKNVGTEYIKAKFGGRGVSDESLYNDACAFAMERLHVTKAQLLKIQGVVNALTIDERRRVVEIIGQSEHEVQLPRLDASGNMITAPNGDIVYETRVVNIRGACTIALLATFTPSEILDYLRGSNMLDTTDNRIKAILASPRIQKVKDSLNDFDKDTTNFFKKKTSLELLAERMSGIDSRTGKKITP